MCRIAGILNRGWHTNEITPVVQQMCDLQKHGGPDDGGLYVAEGDHIVLGNRRLALLDLSNEGHQPMQYENRYFITYNGELYNFAELKDELVKLGHAFNNQTDTEVVLAAFSQWSTQSFGRLNGMFAFALWDNLEKELYLVRDTAGIKPLYYSISDGFLAFASEIRAFAPINSLKEENESWPIYLMAYGYIPEPVTTEKHIKPLHKGCFIKYETKSHSFSCQSFNHYSFSNQLTNPEGIEKNIRLSLEESVKRHLVADAPIGVFLSGGLDSGILAAIAAKYQHASLKTLSIYFEEHEYSEKKYQDILIKRLQCDHHQHLLREDEFHASIPVILQNMDMPSCDGINTWFISKYAASQGLKAVLSGVGGDELFGGYPSFDRLRIASLLQQLPQAIIKSGKRSSYKKLNRMSYLNMEGIKGIYLFLRGHFSPYEIARQLGAYETDVWKILKASPVLTDIDNLEYKNQASWMEFNLYMQNQLLRDSDVMSMIHGVEIRVPFLDDDVIRLAMKIAPEIKYRGTISKQILIDSFNDMIPEEIWNRSKMGFSFPFTKWLGSSKYVSELMSNGNKNTRASYEKFKKGNLHWSHLMSLIILSNRQKVN